MVSATTNLLTINDYRQLPEGPPYYQLIEGRLLISPSPNRYHQVICRNLLILLNKYLEENRVGEVYQAPSDVYLTSYDVYQPDLYFISNANAGILTPQGASGAPDLVIEILSAGTEHYDRNIKRKIYAQAGVKELWLVNPELKVVELFHLNAGEESASVTYGAGDSFTSPLLPGLTISTAQVFQPARLG